MIHFEWLWAFLAFPLPFFIRFFLPEHHPIEQSALKVPFLNDFVQLKTEKMTRKSVKPSHLFYLAILAWFCLVLAAMRPQWLGEPIEQAISGRDLMLAIDLSASMQETDFVLNNQNVDRLTAEKFVARDFINRRVGDRLGLILFGTQAYLQVPLTFDRKTVITLLDESVIGLAGDNTAIGDAIGVAIKRLKNQPAQSRVLILMTDGANTAGEISPLKAAELAAEHHLKIYTIGIGADEMTVGGFFGFRKVNPSLDLDEKTLIKVAQLTGGQYFRARNISELDNIYMRLDELEPVEKAKQFFRPQSELYFYPLTIALTLAFTIVLAKSFFSQTK